MKNIIKLKAIRRIAGIIALVAVIGFSFAACDDGSTGGGGGGGGNGGKGGTFTVTGIPSEYIGWDLGVYSYGDSYIIKNGRKYDLGSFHDTISSGSISVTVVIETQDEGTFFVPNDTQRYTGNDTWHIHLEIDDRRPGHYSSAVYRQYKSVKFSNGSATVQWSQGTTGF
jgi:hypothetical protein